MLRLRSVGQSVLVLLALVGGGFAQADTVFTTQTPDQDYCDNASSDGCDDYELGMKFTSSVDGLVTAIRYWRTTADPADYVHTGQLWLADGSLVAGSTVTFTNPATPTAGWQTALLTTPVAISANTTYIVSVNAQAYAATLQGLASPITNGILTSIAGNPNSNGNGVLSTTIGTFPGISSGANANYFRDVDVTPVPLPAAAWLFASACAAGAGVMRRRRA
jgi:hypothetical protein